MNWFMKNCIRKPLTILVLSFAVGSMLDCLAESAGAQELDPAERVAQESRNLFEIRSARYYYQEDATPEEELKSLLVDGQELTKPIMDIDMVVIDPSDNRPDDLSRQKSGLNYGRDYPGNFQHRFAMWCAPNIRYQPLYFEHVNLERYGYNHCGDFWQPVDSAVHFANSFALMPFNMLRDRPGSCTYPLGFCRPGSIAPQTRDRWLLWR